VPTSPPRRTVQHRWTGRLSLLAVLLLVALAPLLVGAAAGDGRTEGFDRDGPSGPPGHGTSGGGDERSTAGAGGAVATRGGRTADVDAGTRGGAPAAGPDHGTAATTVGAPRTSPAVTRPLASHGPLLVRAPSAAPVLVGYHEAGNPHGLELAPVGELLAHRNTTRVDAPDDDPAGTPYLILSSRGQAAPATSAADVVMRDDDPVLAPVSGVVSDVRTYYLYGQHLDHRVEIVPRVAPHLRVVLIHVDDVQVVPGDEVRAGDSVLARTALRFPFASQIDRDTDPDRWPHVHLEVQPVGAPRPGDQLEEADDAD
jgi:hypothetical protein